MYHQVLVSKPNNYMKAQLKEHASNDKFKLFSNLSKIHRCNLPLNPCHDSFSRKKLSQMKLIETCLRSNLNNKNLSNLMKIALESPVEITDGHLEEIVDV